MQLNRLQKQVINSKIKTRIFLEGAAGSGKTVTGVERMRYLMGKPSVSAGSILILTPQRALGLAYESVTREPGRSAGAEPLITTLGGLARQMVDLFWPLVAEKAGFAHPDLRPLFLTLETSQYTMQHVIGPLIDERDYFVTVAINRNRLYSQIIDNLNKAALVGFPHTQIAERLKAAWIGEIAQEHIYDEAQDCAERFRAYCLQHNLLDFSLQVELFVHHLWQMDEPRQYLTNRYKHLIVDNIEEDTPVTHWLLSGWLDQCKSALIIYDQDAGYRRFLGADPDNALLLAEHCDQRFVFEKMHVTSPELDALQRHIGQAFGLCEDPLLTTVDPRTVIHHQSHQFHPQMITWTAESIASLVHAGGVRPSEIVVLAPFLSDALRFDLVNRLEKLDVPTRSHRPSRALRQEPAAACLLALAQIAHPGWGMAPTTYDLAYALTEAIDELDLVRAQLLVTITYRDGRLAAFRDIPDAAQERITYKLGERFDQLCDWLSAYHDNPVPAIDQFFSRLFGELLSQPGFGFHNDYEAARVAANLIDSARAFRWMLEGAPALNKPIAQEYVEMVAQGVIADQYLRDWRAEDEEAVLLAPAYTFLMRNQPVDYQFWLNVGSSGWWERLYQPLTHPYVLSLSWHGGLWTDTDEVHTRNEALYRLVLGLTRRCRREIFLGLSDLGEQGYEQRGPLLEAIQRMLRRLNREDTDASI